jgi:hypothetical protein
MGNETTTLFFQIENSQIYHGLLLLLVGMLGIIAYFIRDTINNSSKRDEAIEFRLNKKVDEIKKDIMEDVKLINICINDVRDKAGDALQVCAVEDKSIEAMEKEFTIVISEIHRRLDQIEGWKK